MKKIRVGEKEVNILGTPYTCCIYKREFGSSLLKDIELMYRDDILDEVSILQMTWALAKTCNKSIEPFDEWVQSLEYMDVIELQEKIGSEINNATFRKSEEPKAK